MKGEHAILLNTGVVLPTIGYRIESFIYINYAIYEYRNVGFVKVPTIPCLTPHGRGVSGRAAVVVSTL